MGLLLLNLLGCATPFEGTWFFQLDRNVKESGDCVDDDTDYQVTYSGTQNAWVDIYLLQSGEYAVLLSEALVGTAEGNALEASWEYAYSYDDYEERESLEIDGTLEGGVLSGTLTSSISQTYGDDAYACTTKVDYTAERNVSAPDSYPGN